MTDDTLYPIPLTIIGGFLGAGKTTLLNRILSGEHGLRVAVLVNDFGAINIDSQLVVGVEGERTIQLENGCICCSIRGDLVEASLDLLRREQPPEYVIIETSGVSDPLAVAETFLRPELRQLIRLDSILTMVDAEQVLDLDNEQAMLALDQLGVADIVILNKMDLIDEVQRERVEAWVRDIVPVARIYHTQHADVPLELILGVGLYDLERMMTRPSREVHVHEGGEHDHHHDDHATIFDSFSWRSEKPIAFKALKKAVEDLPVGIFRAKGILFIESSPDRSYVLHVVGKRGTLKVGEPWGGQTPHSQIVAIGQPGEVEPDALRELFEGTLAENQTGSAADVLRGALNMLRRRS
jgi:G3E family GTPase